MDVMGSGTFRGNMFKQDGRKLTAAELTELRKRGVTAVQNGESPEVVARSLCINRVTIHNWLAFYRSGGWDALSADKHGGRKPKLDGKAMRWIYDAVTMKNPEQFNFKFALWTSKMLGSIIRKKVWDITQQIVDFPFAQSAWPISSTPSLACLATRSGKSEEMA